jgi:undecaprenyl-diphosphatase
VLAVVVTEARQSHPPHWDIAVWHSLSSHKHDTGSVSLRTILEVPIDSTVELVVLGVVAAIVVAIAVRRRFGAALFACLSFAGALLLTTVIKDLVRRHALDPTDAGYSFPSGHAATSMAIAAAFTIEAWRTRWRMLTLTIAAVSVALLGIAMVYDGAHWPSDVVGGWCVAIAWVALLSAVFRTVRARSASDPPAPRPAVLDTLRATRA